MNQQTYFITGTDTHIGKTYVTTHLLNQFNQQGLSTVGLKPIASGATCTEEGLVNEDAHLLQKTASTHVPLTDINPFVFAPAIAPHLAAKQNGITLNCDMISQRVTQTINHYQPDRCLIEGAGGIAVPINDQEIIADLIKLLNVPVILVVGIRLGCINHAILSSELIDRYKIRYAGWIANCIEPECEEKDEIIATLQKKISAQLIKIVDFNEKPD